MTKKASVEEGVVLQLMCSCGWSKTAEANDPQGRMLEILRVIHESTFTGHKVVIENE